MLLWSLFCCFFKIGLFTFGGGYAMLPLMQAELVGKHKWITDEDLLDYFSLSQCTPGVIAVNLATFVGFKINRFAGAVVATAAVVTPSLIIISAVATVLTLYMDNPTVTAVFNGVRIVVVALIANILIDLWRKGIKDKFGFIVFYVSLMLVIFANLSPALLVVSVMGYSVLQQRFLSK